MANYIDYSSLSIRQLASIIQERLSGAESQAELIPQLNFKSEDMSYGGGESVTFTVPYVDSASRGFEEYYQNTSKKVHALLSPVISEMRAQGVIFTQPMGVPGKEWNSNSYQGGFISFTVAPNPELSLLKHPAHDQMDDLLGEGAGRMGVLTMRLVERDTPVVPAANENSDFNVG